MPVPVYEITKERLGKWSMRMNQANATPVVLIGIGHDQNEGKVVVCTLEEPDMPIGLLRAVLKEALAGLG